MKFTNFKISHECIFPIENTAHVHWHETFYQISVNFRNPGFHSVSKPQKPVFIEGRCREIIKRLPYVRLSVRHIFA